MGTRATHKVLFNHDLAILVLTHTKHRSLVQHRVHHTARADEVATPCDDHPKTRVDEIVLDRDEDANEDGKHHEKERVLEQDGRELLLELHLIVESLVDEV